MAATVLPSACTDDAVAVLCEAFADYPVMRRVLGAAPDYPRRLRTLIGFFVAARHLRDDLVLGALDATGALAAVALVTLPRDHPPPPALAERREAVWGELGADARHRYEAYSVAAHRFEVHAPHHHLNMIGVRPAREGQGHARTLLDHLHRLVEAHPDSRGVTLTTESAGNLSLYERFGYRQVGYVRVADDFETWALFRARGA
jgi:ribosomal protein S18 acetylase RimI-like enzyme